MEIRIPAREWKKITICLEEAYPGEGCGLLGGRRLHPDPPSDQSESGPGAGQTRPIETDVLAGCPAIEVVEAFPALNAWPDDHSGASPLNRFRIAPSFHRRIHRQLQERGFAIVGIFHSHPDTPPQPSDSDRRLAWPELVSCIVEVIEGRTKQAAVWLPPDLRRQAGLTIIG